MSTETIILPNSWRVQEGQNLLVKRTWIDKFDYAEVEVSKEKHFFFEANGLHLRLSVGEHGFNLWDNDNHQWIIDASVIGSLAHFSIGNNDVFSGVILEPVEDKHNWTTFNIRPKIVIELPPE